MRIATIVFSFIRDKHVKKVIVLLGISNGQEEAIEEMEKRGKICNKDYIILVHRVW